MRPSPNLILSPLTGLSRVVAATHGSRRGLLSDAAPQLAAAEAAVGLALIITIYRHFRTANVDKVEDMKG